MAGLCEYSFEHLNSVKCLEYPGKLRNYWSKEGLSSKDRKLWITSCIEVIYHIQFSYQHLQHNCI
jgi:hypothetical protein